MAIRGLRRGRAITVAPTHSSSSPNFGRTHHPLKLRSQSTAIALVDVHAQGSIHVLHEYPILPRPLGDAPASVVDRALPIGLVIQGIDLPGVRAPIPRLRVNECHAKDHGPLRDLWGRGLTILLGGIVSLLLIMHWVLLRRRSPPFL